MPKPGKAPTQLFLVTSSATKAKPGKKLKSFGYTAQEVAYYRLTPNHTDYLKQTHLWPVKLLPETTLKQDAIWARWNFNVAEVGKPLKLSDPAAWQMLVDAGLKKKPRSRRHDSALIWPALKGYTDALRVLLDAGLEPGHDDPMSAAAASGNPVTAKLLASRGYDVKAALATMERYNNQTAIKVLRALLKSR